MRKEIFSLVLLLAAASLGFGQTEKPLLLRDPALSKTHIVFVYAGDLWIVSREGGEATRLTTGLGHRDFIRSFRPMERRSPSPASTTATSTSTSVPASGGVPQRLTYHPGQDAASGWTPDGKQCSSSRAATANSGRPRSLFTIPVDGVFPTESRCRWPTKVRIRPTARGWLTCRCRAAFKPGSAIAAGWHVPSGSPTWRIRASRRSRARIRTTSTRCGSATRSTSSPIATARSRSSRMTRSRRGQRS